MLSKLQSLKEYSKFVPDPTIKKSMEYKFFYRPTVTWKCTREKQHEAIKVMEKIDIEKLETGGNLLTGAMITAAVYLGLILIPTIIIFCIVVKCRTHCCLTVMISVTLGVEFALGLVVMILSLIASNKYADRAKLLKDLDDAVQGCMDKFSDIPDSVIKEQVEDPANDGRNAATLLTIFAVFIVIKILITLIVSLCICSKRKPKGK